MKLEVLDLLSRKREKEERDLTKGHRESERFMVEIHSSGPRLVFLHVFKSEISFFFFFRENRTGRFITEIFRKRVRLMNSLVGVLEFNTYRSWKYYWNSTLGK